MAVEGGCCAGSQGAARVTVLERSAGLVRLRVAADAPTTVVVVQQFYPGWTATVDGQPSAIHAANILFQSVEVAGGSHEVTLRYQPSSFTIAAIVTGLGILFLVALVAADRVPRRRRGRSPEATR